MVTRADLRMYTLFTNDAIAQGEEVVVVLP
jgi:hypothetical protein